MDPHIAESVTAFRTSEDISALQALVGRFVEKYFPGYGTYIGKIISINKDDCAAIVVYEDGAPSHLFLDQIQDILLPSSFRPSHTTELEPGVEKYGCAWPPPSLSSKLIVNEPRRRKLSEVALQRILMEQSLQLERDINKRKQKTTRIPSKKSASPALKKSKTMSRDNTKESKAKNKPLQCNQFSKSRIVRSTQIKLPKKKGSRQTVKREHSLIQQQTRKRKPRTHSLTEISGMFSGILILIEVRFEICHIPLQLISVGFY